ncbi:MAG: hypothetical protein DRQ24_11230 [Candidatus Latescibacterota bacterium]|nr:MAG: hypothetical protein DRQ24_11230 [Candidatus Latescibacterota bacterium]
MSEEYYNCKVFTVKVTDSSPSRTLILKRDNKDKLYIGLLESDKFPDTFSRFIAAIILDCITRNIEVSEQ